MITYNSAGRPAYNKVWYHANCPDGFCAAMLAWRQLKAQGHHVDYVPVSYGEYIPEYKAGDRILILDFSFKLPIMKDILQTVEIVTILDHHKTAWDELASLPVSVFHFDADRSGAVMTHHFFYPDAPVPKLVQYVQDRDLWTWSLKNSREISACLDTYPKSFEIWNTLFFGSSRPDVHVMASKGRNILESQKIQVERLASRAKPWKIAGYDGWVLNSTIYHSEIGHYLLEHKDESFVFACCYFITNDGIVHFSLRSRKEFNCSEIAKTFGGGGHPQAAGFELSLSQFQELYEVNCGKILEHIG